MWKSCKADPPDYGREVVLIYRVNEGLKASTAIKVKPGESEEGWKLRPWSEAWFIPLMWAEMPSNNEIWHEDTRI